MTKTAIKTENKAVKKKRGPFKTAGLWFLRFLALIMTLVIFIAATLLVSLKMICSDISPSAKRTFVTTLLETGQLKFLASWFLSPEQIQELVEENSMEKIDDEVNSALITVTPADTAGDDGSAEEIEVIPIAGRNYSATLLKIKDPSRVCLASIYPWRDKGVNLDELVKSSGAVAGINGGLYNSYNNSGGRPYGVVVANGEIQLNDPTSFTGLVLIGFTEDNILQIIDLAGMTRADVEKLVADNHIRDAVTFQEESTDANNHFVQLIINGNARGMNGMGSGLNPRTAIGQCADGSVLMLVTDGRGKSGHLGASASDLIEIMQKYGAVNAANLDGGSSSCMYMDGEYLMTSVTFYYSNESWRMPVAFVVK